MWSIAMAADHDHAESRSLRTGTFRIWMVFAVATPSLHAECMAIGAAVQLPLAGRPSPP